MANNEDTATTLKLVEFSESLLEKNLRASIERNVQRNLVYCVQDVMVEMIRMVQQHRGSVLGFLGNHCSFEENIQSTREKVDACLNIARDYPEVVNQDALRQVNLEWETVSYISSIDTPMQQFELHGHLINELIDFIWEMTRTKDHVMSNNEELQKYNKLLQKDFLQYIEKVGQCRALATLISAYRTKDDFIQPFESKLTFIVRGLIEELDTIYLAFSYLDKSLSHAIFSLLSSCDCKYKIRKLHEVVENSIISTDDIAIKTETVFYLFTMAMDELYEVFNKGVRINMHYAERTLL